MTRMLTKASSSWAIASSSTHCRCPSFVVVVGLNVHPVKSWNVFNETKDPPTPTPPYDFEPLSIMWTSSPPCTKMVTKLFATSPVNRFGQRCKYRHHQHHHHYLTWSSSSFSSWRVTRRQISERGKGVTNRGGGGGERRKDTEEEEKDPWEELYHHALAESQVCRWEKGSASWCSCKGTPRSTTKHTLCGW